MNISHFQFILASIVTGVWIISLIVRVVRPELSDQFRVLDTIILLVFGFIFGVSAIRKNGANK